MSLLSAMIVRNNGRPILNLMLNQVRALGNGMRSGYVRVLIGYVRHCSYLARHQGIKGLVLYLKVCHVAFAQGLAKDFQSFPQVPRMRRSSGGLPTFIPLLHRRRILAGDSFVIQYWFTLLSIYRVLEFPGKLSIKTVTDPGPSIAHLLAEYSAAAKIFWTSMGNMGWLPENLFTKKEGFTPLAFLHSLRARTFIIPRTTPSAAVWLSTSPQGIIGALTAWGSSPELYIILQNWMKMTKNISFLNWIEEIIPWSKSISRHIDTGYFGTGELGRIGLKDEPAGKVRVFAIVDPITQWLLKPLHDALFEILRKIPQDGTFDQLQPIYRLQQAGFTRFWSFDLSAATDRLPVLLQSVLLSLPLTAWGANIWMTLLTGRSYTLPGRFAKAGFSESSIMYRVGQPIGALSSWAMLAITHHFLVQYAAWSSGTIKYGQWFEQYAVLGDDIVIANEAIATRYLAIMDELGVGINLSKSIRDTKGSGVLEFAKRIFVRGISVGPLPLLEVIASIRTLSGWLEMSRNRSLTLSQALISLGYGWRAVSMINRPVSDIARKLQGYVLSWYGPGGIEPIDTLNWLRWNGVGGRTRDINPDWIYLLIDSLLARVKDLLPICQSLAKMVEVDRTRTHYGTAKYTATMFPFLRTVSSTQLGSELNDWIKKDPRGLFLLLTVPGATISDSDYRGLIRLIEFCYRESFSPLLSDLRAIERELIALRESTVLDPTNLDTILTSFNSLEETLDGIQAVKAFNWRTPEVSPLRYVKGGLWVRRWRSLKMR